MSSDKHGAGLVASGEIASAVTHHTQGWPSLNSWAALWSQLTSPDTSLLLSEFLLVALGDLCHWLISPEAISICQINFNREENVKAKR